MRALFLLSMIRQFYLLVILTCGLWTTSSIAQHTDSINFNRLESRKLVKLLDKNAIHTLKDLNQIELACYVAGADSLDYSSHTKSFLIEANIDKVWKAYKTVNPTVVGERKDIVGFGLLYGRSNGKIYYKGDDYEGMEEGQTVFWNLRIWGGLVHLSVGQTIHNINDEQKSFEICYLAPGISHGSQLIQLSSTSEGYTKVIHSTHFKSSSKFRDRRIYPGLHEKAIIEFHEGISEAVQAAFH